MQPLTRRLSSRLGCTGIVLIGGFTRRRVRRCSVTPWRLFRGWCVIVWYVVLSSRSITLSQASNCISFAHAVVGCCRFRVSAPWRSSHPPRVGIRIMLVDHCGAICSSKNRSMQSSANKPSWILFFLNQNYCCCGCFTWIASCCVNIISFAKTLDLASIKPWSSRARLLLSCLFISTWC